jgi:hypothetical protein
MRTLTLALGCAIATATLLLVTFVASSLALSVVAAVGPADGTTSPRSDAAVQGVLVAADGREETACKRDRAASRDDRESRKCAGQRVGNGGARP